ncbi:MAG TPA: response regulator transcription factor [Dehalococcoidia bacterium]|nr:response regulator transcription factor [Dehalococcoidia bacterium]
MAATILVVDDEKHIVELARIYLRNEGFQIEAAYDGREALEKARAVKPALIVLDLMLPELDGMEVCRALRKESDVPIVMLTARSDDMDKIIGLELGADDYLTKPFNPRELVARIKAVLRRSEAGKRPAKVVEVGDLKVDVLGREVFVAGAPVALRAKEFDLLLALSRNAGVAMARDRLLNTVWGEDFFGDQRTLDVHVAWLRDKIGASTAKIVTVWGFGYKLTAPEPAAADAVAGPAASPA